MSSNTPEFPIVGVGASAGGLEALRTMFSGHEEVTGMAFVVVQHLDPNHESLMAQLIERYTSMRVKQAEGGERIEQDNIYVIPPGHGLAVKDGVLHLTEFKDPRGMRRPIDDFFESLAIDRGARSGCVILSGTGADGSRGMRAIKENGGVSVAQHPQSAAYDGMPSSAIGTGLVDIVADPGEILAKLIDFFDRGPVGGEDLHDVSEVADHVDELCSVLHEAVGHDFSQYKRSTLNRRVARRMQLLGMTEGGNYLERLRDDDRECQALFRDLLINVTRFFRDSDHFAVLASNVIEPLVQETNDGDAIRVWVPGCSSGEEAYSIAMLFAAMASKHSKRPYVQIFATDIDEAMLDQARAATYPLAAISDIPREYQQEYTLGGSDRFSIAPRVRDMVRFSMHNVVRDPPYSKIDLVCCRNLLIYFDEELQKIAVPLFHFALRKDGYLFLGSSETIGRHEDLFEAVDQAARLFRRKNTRGTYQLNLADDTGRRLRQQAVLHGERRRPRAPGMDVRALRLMAEKYAPVSLLIDNEGTLLDRWGAAGRYLEFPDRIERTIHVPTLAKPGLREVVGPLIRKVQETGRRALATSVNIRTGFGDLEARVICEEVDEGALLLVIEETGELQLDDGEELDRFDLEDSQRQFLEDELQTTRHRLRSTVEELETTNEELKSSNEEMMSMNEELQSTNEELTTVNDELKNKVDQLTIANSDLKNFFDSTQLPVLVVDADCRLRSYTDAALRLFPINKGDVGRLLSDLPNKLQSQTFVRLAMDAAKDGVQKEANLHSPQLDAEYIVRAIPYRLLDGRIDGATLVFTDVTKALSLERDLREERQRLRLALEVANIGIWEYEPSTDRTVLDDTERALLNISDEDPGDSMEPILAALPADDRDRINRALRMAIEGEELFDETFRLPLPDGETRWLHGLGKQIDVFGERKFIGVTFDVSNERALLDQRELMIREMNHRVKNLFSVIAAMVSISARNASDIASFAESLRDRIHALGRSHALTNTAVDAGGRIDLGELVQTVLKPSQAEQELSLSGDAVPIGNDKITSLALILHEWATNSAKYGALATPDGSLSVEWHCTDGEVELTWHEEGRGASGQSAGEKGFGTRLVDTAARQLHGSAEGEASDAGYRRVLRFPITDQS